MFSLTQKVGSIHFEMARATERPCLSIYMTHFLMVAKGFRQHYKLQ